MSSLTSRSLRIRLRLGACRKVFAANRVASISSRPDSARKVRHCCSVRPAAWSDGRKWAMTASRARSRAIGSDWENGRRTWPSGFVATPASGLPAATSADLARLRYFLALIPFDPVAKCWEHYGLRRTQARRRKPVSKVPKGKIPAKAHQPRRRRRRLRADASELAPGLFGRRLRDPARKNPSCHFGHRHGEMCSSVRSLIEGQPMSASVRSISSFRI